MQAFFLSGHGGQRFCLYYPASNQNVRGTVIYLHPFAEEMNKSRRMAAQQARAMAEAGFAVLQIDLLGCGDSSGDFGDASWQAWQEDVLLAHDWLRGQSPSPLTVWGLRSGCLLAASVADKLPEETDFIFWQPVVSGKQHWQQFMRLKIAGELASGHGKEITELLKQQLAAGQTVEIAGYCVSPELVNGLCTTELHPPAGRMGKVSWFELSKRDNATLAPVSSKYIEQWRAAGFKVEANAVHGPAFWQTTEIEDAPELISATLAAMESG